MLIRIGNRIIDLNAIAHARYDPDGWDVAEAGPRTECAVSFSCDDYQVFYGTEADLMWKLLSDRALNLTPLPEVTA